MVKADAVIVGSQLWLLPYPMTAVTRSLFPPAPAELVEAGPLQAEMAAEMAAAAVTVPP
jgi:hypothetical protein